MATRLTEAKGKETTNDRGAILIVGIMIPLIIAGLLILLGWILIFDPLQVWSIQNNATIVTQVHEAIVMMLAAGVGSSVYVIRAYLKHACEDKDFDAGYIPWYPFRQVMGMLLGLIFYFTIRGGLLLFVIENGEADMIKSLNIWALAAAGALVGLFSRYAIEKLREVFVKIFAIRED